MPRRSAPPLHAWNLAPGEGRALQRELAGRVVTEGEPAEVQTIAGVDVSVGRDARVGHAAIVVLRWPGLEVIETASASAPLAMPYVPGLLSFREVPVVLAAWEKLQAVPDLVFVDGHGRAHPRRLGVASHLGLWIQRPTIGVAKRLLVGSHEPLGPEPGGRAAIVHRGETIGVALRTRARANPIYVSSGNGLSLEAAVRWVLACQRGYRLPEPTRLAHLASNAARLADAGEAEGP